MTDVKVQVQRAVVKQEMRYSLLEMTREIQIPNFSRGSKGQTMAPTKDKDSER